MSGETEREVSGWTVDTLHKHLADAMQAHKDSHTQAGQAGLMIWDDHRREHEQQQRAIDRADQAINARLAGINEFRAQLRDQQGTFITREVLDATVTALNQAIRANADKIDALATRIDRSEGQGSGLSSAWQLVLGFGGLLAAVSTVIYAIHAITGR